MKRDNNNFVFGTRIISDLLVSSQPFSQIFLKNNHSLLPLIKKKQLPYQICDQNFFFTKFPHENHQFIAASLKEYQYYPLSDLIKNLRTHHSKHWLFLILDHLNDPYNFGAIIRVAQATGVDAIIVANFNQAPVNAQTIKASTGAIFGMKIVKIANLTTFCKQMQKYHFWFYATTVASDAKNYREYSYKNANIGLIIGNENRGISHLLKKNSDFHIHIPVLKVASLNVSNATAIVLYEIRNQQKFWSLH